MILIVTITQIDPPSGERDTSAIEHYRRRVEMPEVQTVIDRLDAALKVKARKTRSDAGQNRKEAK